MKKQQIRFCIAIVLLSFLVFVPVSRALAEKPAGNLTPEQEGVKLTVTIEGPGEAKWLFQGKSFDSGHTLADVPDGKHTVVFSDVPGWDKPADAELALARGHVVSIHGKYIRHLGALAAKAEGPEGARWVFDGKEYESGEEIQNLPTGEYKVSFTEVADWTAPGEKTVTVSKNKTAVVDEKYVRHTGSVAVKIDGPKEARWVFQGKQYESGQTVGNVPTGKYAVTFADVPDWTRPGDASVAVAKDGTASLDGKYVRHTGSVTVRIDGPKEARWVFGGKQYESGQTVSNVPTGKYPVAFNNVPNWTGPDGVSVTVKKGETASAFGAYAKHTGSLTVSMEGPKDISWSLNDRGNYANGQTIGNLDVGPVTVSFSEIAGWNKPENVRVTIKNETAEKVSAAYVRQTGSVKVDIAGTKDGRWSLDGKGNYPGSWTEKNIPTGSYKIVFSDVTGRIKPESLPVTVTPDKTASVKAEYINNTGFITVKIDGPAEARWAIDGKGSYESGQTVGEILPGGRTVSFTYVKGWKSPADVKVTVQKDGTATVEGAYQKLQ
ncbi:MAG: hypothetical protein ACOX5A_11210 [Aminivibrio sp.]